MREKLLNVDRDSGRLARHLLRRVAFIPVGAFLVATVAFGLVNLAPGDPARAIAGTIATEADVQEVRERLGLDRPVAERYVTYVAGLIRGDLGRSFYTGRPVSQEIFERLGNSLELIILSLIVAVSTGTLLGGLSAYLRGGLVDRAGRMVTGVLQAVPDFSLGLLLIYVFFYLLGWAPPPVGRLGIGVRGPPSITGAVLLDALLAGDFTSFAAGLKYAILPVLTLGLYYSSHFARTVRTLMSEALSSKEAEFARACGLHERTVLIHALRNIRTPTMTYVAILFGALLGGDAIVETVFAWDGIGQWAVEVILKLDTPSILGFVVTAGMLSLIAYSILDLLVAILDPRVRYD